MSFYNGKVVYLTGAGSGMGRAMAIQLAAAGAKLALNDWNQANLEATVKASPETDVLTESFDVSDRDKVYDFANEVIQHFGHIDIVINNAGIALPELSIEQIGYESFEKIVNINMWGMIYGTKAFLPYLRQRPKAAIANVSSVFGIHGYPGQGPYVTTKFAIRGFTETLRIELKNTNISVSSIHPGGIKTNIVSNIEMEDEAKKKEMISGFDQLAITSSEKAARIILNGIMKGKSRILIGKDATILDWISRLFPSSYEKIIMRGREVEF